MVYLQIKKMNNKVLHTLNICNKVKNKETGEESYKSATEYLTPIEYKVLKDSGLFTEKEEFVKE